MNRFMPEHGAPKTMTYLPENEPELMMILKRERFKRSYHATAGKLEEYLDKLEKTTLREKLKRAKTGIKKIRPRRICHVRTGGRTGKRTHGGTWHYQPVGISAKDGRRRLHHSP